ncbi:MAG: carboxylating nicotinate-nucleotide diphosphorylase [Acidobacteriota bacterium]
MTGSLELALYRDIVRRALDEDAREGDITTAGVVSASQRAKGVLLAKSDCVVAGLDVAFQAFRQLDVEVATTVYRKDGETCRAGEAIATVVGFASPMLTAERTALNFLQRLSGIATRARQFVDAAAGRIVVLDTRKTTPTLRALEKYAVRVGGATNHRANLSDAVLIKDNHIKLGGGVKAAVKRFKRSRPGLPIEIEAQSLAEVDDALEAGADRILLDNLSIVDIREAVARVGKRATTEVSGGVTLERMDELAATGANFVSVGALTHSAPAADISLEIEPL